jgi:beta-glucosidase
MSGECSSRTELEMPDAQRDLLDALLKTGKPVVLVHFSGRPTVMTWEQQHVPSILNVWFGGSESADAICDVLFGDVCPSGKLTATFPQNVGQLPMNYNHKNTGRPLAEGRWFEKFRSNYIDVSNDPLYPFGYGLSYTQFEYLKAVTDKELYQANDTVCVTVQLKNTGKRTGKEVIQVYMRDVVSSVMTPVKQLKGFRKVDLLPGQTRETTIMIPVHEFYLTDDLGNRYLESGKFELQVGTSSDRIYFNLPVYIGSSGKGGQTVSGTSFKSRTDGKVIQVKGTVRDIQATPLAGVKVQSEESGESALTDYRGTYTIKVKDNGRLIFSKKGFADKTIEVEGQTDVSIQMAKGE